MHSDYHDISPTQLGAAFTDHDLCARTGTCVGICPTDALSLNEAGFPVLAPEKCTRCGKCGQVCPGKSVHFEALTQTCFPNADPDCGFDGHVHSTLIAHSTDDTLREGGSGGGIATTILDDLLEQEIVDGCLVTKMDPNKPWRGIPFVATTREELKASQGSKYLVIPLNAILQELQSRPGKFALAALPCQIHGIRKAAETIPWVREKIHLIVGLFCGGALEPDIVPDMLRTKKIDPQSIGDFQFRGGEWPGSIRAILKDGSTRKLHYSNYKDGAYNYVIGLYLPKRCQTCIDGSSEFSDVSISDAWTKDEQGEYKYRKSSRILTRTAIGEQVVRDAAARNRLELLDVSKDPSHRTHRMQTKRKGITAAIRVARLKSAGTITPEYDRTCPPVTFMERVNERLVTSVLNLAESPTFRYTLLKTLTSRAAIPLITLRLFLKKRKYKRRAQHRSSNQQ